MPKLAIIFLFALLLPGCGKSLTPSDLSQEETETYGKIVIYMKGQSDTPQQYITLGPVEGVDCKRNAYSGQSATPIGAFESMKAVAARLGASAIINVECADEGVSWSRNCWQTHVCGGMAIK